MPSDLYVNIDLFPRDQYELHSKQAAVEKMLNLQRFIKLFKLR